MNSSPSSSSFLVGRHLQWLSESSLTMFLLPHKDRFSILCPSSQSHRVSLICKISCHYFCFHFLLAFANSYAWNLFPKAVSISEAKEAPTCFSWCRKEMCKLKNQIKQISFVIKSNFSCTTYLKKCVAPKDWHCLSEISPL